VIAYQQLRTHIRRHLRYLPYDRRRGGPGKNIAPAANSGTWATNINGGAAGTLTQDSGGLHFNGANNSATMTASGIGTVDNGVYLVQFTITGLTGGSVKAQIGGATSGHFASGPVRSANGSYTAILTTSGAGTSTNMLRFIANGANGTNTYTISSVSLRRIT
jgi:hypothetical protein